MGTNYTTPPAPTQPAEKLATDGLSLKYGVHQKEVATPERHPPTSEASLDSIVQNVPGPGQDVADIIVQDKRRFLRATTELLKNLIDERSKIREDNIARLDYKILQCGSYLLNVDPWPPYSNPLVEGRRANLGHAINSLESEKNHETARCWSDQARLYQELQQTLGEYQAVIRRSRLLSGTYR